MSILPIGENTQIKVGEGDLAISSDYLILLLELGVEFGLKQSELLLGSQLDTSIVIRPGISVGYKSFFKVVANFRAKQPDMSLAIVYGKRMTLSKHGALGIAARHSRTANDAASALVTYMSTRAEIFSVRRERNVESRRLYVDLEIESSDDVYFLILAYFISIEFVIRQMLGYAGEIKTRIELPIKPELWYDQPLEKNTVEIDKEAQGAELHFSAQHCLLLWPTDILDDLLPLFDSDLVTMAQEVCEDELKSILQPSSVSQVVARAFKDAEGSLPTVDSIATTLNTSAATLKRKLKAEGHSFRDIKDEVLYNKAMKYLRDTQQSIELIAEQLGYSDASNFAKAFKGWSGISPSDFRKTLVC